MNIKNLKINKKAVATVLAAAQLYSVGATQAFADSYTSDDDFSYIASEEVHGMNAIDVINISDLKLVYKDGSVVNSSDLQIQYNDALNTIDEPAMIMIDSNIQVIYYKNRKVSREDFRLINRYTQEEVKSLDYVMVGGTLLNMSYNSTQKEVQTDSNNNSIVCYNAREGYNTKSESTTNDNDVTYFSAYTVEDAKETIKRYISNYVKQIDENKTLDELVSEGRIDLNIVKKFVRVYCIYNLDSLLIPENIYVLNELMTLCGSSSLNELLGMDDTNGYWMYATDSSKFGYFQYYDEMIVQNVIPKPELFRTSTTCEGLLNDATQLDIYEDIKNRMIEMSYDADNNDNAKLNNSYIALCNDIIDGFANHVGNYTDISSGTMLALLPTFTNFRHLVYMDCTKDDRTVVNGVENEGAKMLLIEFAADTGVANNCLSDEDYLKAHLSADEIRSKKEEFASRFGMSADEVSIDLITLFSISNSVQNKANNLYEAAMADSKVYVR